MVGKQESSHHVAVTKGGRLQKRSVSSFRDTAENNAHLDHRQTSQQLHSQSGIAAFHDVMESGVALRIDIRGNVLPLLVNGG
jgi:hypothetical protein